MSAARRMNNVDLDFLSHGVCPFCSGREFQPGPRGGASQNFECTSCRSRFNLTIYEANVVIAEHIGHRVGGSDWSMYYKEFSPRPLFQFPS